ncbi:MAG: MarR family transcriptional regulator [Myxococcales bacterium]|nr:MarR family transcriptional regulator [Myxococcales bacterium]
MSDALLLDSQLCFALYAASRTVTAAYTPHLKPLGLTYPQYLVLLVLWERDGVRVSQLGERLYLDSATLTPLLKRMQAQGVLERRRSQEDERVVELFLTPHGKRLKRRAEEIPSNVFANSGLSVKQARELKTSLQALTRRLREQPD